MNGGLTEGTLHSYIKESRLNYNLKNCSSLQLYESANCMEMFQDRMEWQAFVIMAMNILAP
jgi:hypothetical protein